MRSRNRLIYAMFFMLAGCAPRQARVAATAVVPDSFEDFVDLKPGLRVRVVTPLLKSGGYRVEAKAVQSGGNNITMSAGSDFLGYETSWYSLVRRLGGGVRIAFERAEDTVDGKTTQRDEPKLALFGLSTEMRFVRLLYVKRVSAADHEMAVLAARREDLLTALSARVREQPAMCVAGSDTDCKWVPAGISVVAQ